MSKVDVTPIFDFPIQLRSTLSTRSWLPEPMADESMNTHPMRAGVLYGSRDVRLETAPCPAPTAGQVLLRIRRAGICGSDIHYYNHGRCGAFVPTRPFILGHEFVGIVERLGDGISQLALGDRVVVNPAGSCGQCESCKLGRANLCPHVTMLGSASTAPPTNGAFADYVAVAANQCHRISDAITDDLAALAEPLSVVLHAIHRVGGVAGNRVLIVGGGPIGAIAALVARSYGATQVAVSEPNDQRRTLAKSFGVDECFNPMEKDFVEQAKSASNGGFDVVMEASGNTIAVRQCFDVVRRGGRVVQIGTVGGNDATLPVNDIMVREISLIGTFRYAAEFSEAIRVLEGGNIPLHRLVTSIHPLTDIGLALDTACRGADSLKVQIAFDN